jgi:hypothetical protein
MELTSELSQRLETIEQKLTGLIEINQTLLKQNLQLSERLHGRIAEPVNSPSGGDNKKELYYSTIAEGVYLIHGPGTYDYKEKIKSLTGAEWRKDRKAWQVTTTIEELQDIIPEITEKTI